MTARAVETQDAPRYVAPEDHMPIEAIDHVAFWVGNAKQAAHFYQSTMGFELVAYAGPETGMRGLASYVLRQGNITFLLTSGMSPEDPMTQFAHKHGDGVRRVSLRVPDVVAAYNGAVERGATPVEEPRFGEDAGGRAGSATVQMYGDVLLGFVERKDYTGAYWPGFEAAGTPGKVAGVGLAAIDHIVGNVELGKMNEWVAWFQKVMGFELMQHFTDEAITTEYSALMSKVMQDGSGKIKFPINEPAQGKRKSQIEEYLDFNIGPGVQHIAMITGDIVATVDALKQRGLQFLTVPKEYYDDLWDRVGPIREDVGEIERLNIMVDRDEEGYLLQIFTQPVEDRPTLFFEVIQRRGSRGFGEGNFKALFEAIEREQDRRGNL
ncbi:MAG: 4-hydroxyphenylpyruvate dioxygenase [Chloroflexota bacterium]|jgi:4-hydroxyphenylpyruvate dioxygenase|nr:4-hydroxyphenylpyruvate dioxygenase [Chloroflexota bacterium]